MRVSFDRKPILVAVVFSAGLAAIHATAPRAAATAPTVPPPFVTAHAPRHHVPRIRARSSSDSTNWSGYAVDGSGVTDVQGTWTVPSVASTNSTCGASYSAAWVGIDGDTDGTVEQCGTEQDSSGSYYAWYEMYPKGSAFVQNVQPGQTIHAEVHYTGGGNFQLTMTDNGVQILNIVKKLNQAQRSSAEWIMEAPWSGGILPLAEWGSFGFSNCTWQGPAGSPQPIYMVNNSGQPKATPGTWTPAGTTPGSFPVYWNNCQ